MASNLQCKHFVILTLISVVGLGFAMAIPWLASAQSVVARHSNAPLSSDDLCFVKNNETLDEYSSTDASAVQQAVDAASLGDVLLIAGECAGTQTRGGLIQTVYISKSLTLEGGYAPGDWTVERDLETYTTTLDADQGGRVVVISSTAGVNIDGLYLTGGFADNPSLDGNGEGIWTNSVVTLTNTIVYSNTSDWDGGGMYSLGISPFLKGVTFSENVGFYGGALYNDCDSGTSSPMLTDVTFSGNSASYGGAMANMCENGNTSPRLTNVVMSGNAASTGGGLVVSVYNSEGSAVMTNVSFSGNSAVYYGGAIEAEADGECLLVVNNNIFWNTRADGVTGTIDANIHSYGVVYSLTHSLVEGAYTGGSWVGGDYQDGGGNIDQDPLFLDPISPPSAPTTTGNLRLGNGSPAIDAGLNSHTENTGLSTDLDGEARFKDGDGDDDAVVDMGAYEADTRYLLSVSKTGTGDGNVTSTPAGIDCGGTCVEYFKEDTAVTLMAESEEGSLFTGWSEACKGLDECKLTMDADKNITAAFEEACSVSLPVMMR